MVVRNDLSGCAAAVPHVGSVRREVPSAAIASHKSFTSQVDSFMWWIIWSIGGRYVAGVNGSQGCREEAFSSILRGLRFDRNVWVKSRPLGESVFEFGWCIWYEELGPCVDRFCRIQAEWFSEAASLVVGRFSTQTKKTGLLSVSVSSASPICPGSLLQPWIHYELLSKY